MLNVPFHSAPEFPAAIGTRNIGCLELLDAFLAWVDTRMTRCAMWSTAERQPARGPQRAAGPDPAPRSSDGRRDQTSLTESLAHAA